MGAIDSRLGLAALQPGARLADPPRLAVCAVPARACHGSCDADPIAPPRLRTLFIRGVTVQGRAFRPSDWAERLAGVMSSFRPAGAAGGIGAFIAYSPYCVPRVVAGVKCVIVDEALRGIEPMAWDFVMNFARDNTLQVVEAGDAAAEADRPDRPIAGLPAR